MKILVLAAVVGILSAGQSRADDDLFSSTLDLLKSAMVKACSVYPDCTRRVTSFAYFLWKNRDKSDIQYNTMKCLGYSAVNRGYLWSPTKMLDDMTPATAQEIAMEVCDCVVGYWGKDEVCPIDSLLDTIPEDFIKLPVVLE